MTNELTNIQFQLNFNYGGAVSTSITPDLLLSPIEGHGLQQLVSSNRTDEQSAGPRRRQTLHHIVIQSSQELSDHQLITWSLSSQSQHANSHRTNFDR